MSSELQEMLYNDCLDYWAKSLKKKYPNLTAEEYSQEAIKCQKMGLTLSANAFALIALQTPVSPK